MALLDSEIPDGSDTITLELLQLCLGHYCVMKYSPEEDPEARVMIVGLYNTLYIGSSLAEDADPTVDPLSNTKVTMLKGFKEVPIRGIAIEYIYAVDLPVGPNPDLVADLMGFMSEGAR
jgi:hypothetical protein